MRPSSSLPWGISESAYNARDLEFTYQYSNFGVPGLGLKRGLAENAVVAPYATALATMVDASAAARELRPTHARGGSPALRLLRGARLHTVAAARGPGRRDRSRLHGAPPGDDAGRDRERPHGGPDAQPLPRRADRAGDGAAAAGAHAARRGRRSSAGRRDQDRGAIAGAHRAGAAPPSLGARRVAADESALERPLRGHGHGGGIGIQSLARPGGHSLARGRHVRRLGVVRLSARRGQRRRSGPPGYQPSGVEPDRYQAVFSEDRVEISRRDGSIDTTLEILVSPGRRRRGPPHLGRELRQPRAGDRAHVVRRDRAGTGRCGRRPSGVLEALRADGAGRRCGRDSRDAPAPLARRARGLGRAPLRRRRRDCRRARVRDRPRALPRTRTRPADADRRDGRPTALEDGGHGARSGLRAAPPHADSARRDGARRVLDRDRAHARAGPRSGRQAPRPDGLRARLDAGLDAGAGAAPPSGHRLGRREPVPAARRTRALCQPPPAPTAGRAAARRGRATDAVGAGHLGRSTARAGADRRAERSAARARALARARVLALETALGGSGDPERAGPLLRAGSAGRARDAGAHEPVATEARRRRDSRRGLRASRGSDLATGARAPAIRRPDRARQPPREPRRAARPAAGRGARRCAARSQGAALGAARADAAADRSRVPQRSRRLRGGRARVRHGAGRRAVDAGALDQRDREPEVRLSGLGRRRGLHVVGEQPRESAHSLVERSGERPHRRGALPARRRQRRAVGTYGPSDPRRVGALPGSPRTGLLAFRAHVARDRAGAPPVRAARRPDQDLPAHAPESLRAYPASLRDRVRRVGARHVAQRVGAFRRDGDRPALGGALRAESVECSVRRARRVRGPPRPAALLDRGPHRVPRTQRSAGRAGCPRARRRAVESRRRGPGPVRSAADRARAARKRADRGGLPAGPGRGHDRSPRSAGSLSHGRSRRRAAQRHRPLGGDARNGAGQDTGSVHGPLAQSLAPVPDARLSRLGPLRLLSGQRSVRLSRPAPGRDGTRDREARSHTRASPARRRAPVRRGRRPALVAASLGRGCSHADLRRPRLAALRGRALSRRNGGPGRARRARAVPRGRAAPRRRERRLLPAHDLGRRPQRSSSIARAVSTQVSRWAATAFRSSGPATGTTA